MDMRMDMVAKQSARQLIITVLAGIMMTREDVMKAVTKNDRTTRNAARKAWSKLTSEKRVVEAEAGLFKLAGAEVVPPADEDDDAGEDMAKADAEAAEMEQSEEEGRHEGAPPHDAATATGMYDHDDGV